jgi:hypothetical protein
MTLFGQLVEDVLQVLCCMWSILLLPKQQLVCYQMLVKQLHGRHWWPRLLLCCLGLCPLALSYRWSLFQLGWLALSGFAE